MKEVQVSFNCSRILNYFRDNLGEESASFTHRVIWGPWEDQKQHLNEEMISHVSQDSLQETHRAVFYLC